MASDRLRIITAPPTLDRYRQMPPPSDAHKALLQFLYLAPTGLIQTDRSGAIKMINPPAIKWLTALLPNRELNNLFDCLREPIPRLADLSADYYAASGIICNAYRLPLANDHGPAITLELTLLKLDEHNLMACLSEQPASASAEKNRHDLNAHQLARTDVLAELPDFAAVHARIDDALQNRSDDSALAMLAIHCDQLGHLNNAYGQSGSNEPIDAVGSRLHNQIHRNFLASANPMAAPVVGGLSGDQFIVLYGDSPPCEQLESEISGLIRSLSAPYQIGTQAVQTNICTGLVFYGGDSESSNADTVLQQAKTVLQRARQSASPCASHCQRFIASTGEQNALVMPSEKEPSLSRV